MAKLRGLYEQASDAINAKNYDEALKLLDEAEKIVPDQTAAINMRGAVYSKKKEFARADELYRLALAQDPKFFPAEFNLGENLFLQAKYQDASRHFRSMLERYPGNELLLFKIYLSQLEQGDVDEARKWLAKIRFPSDSPAWYYAQAAWEIKEGSKEKAMEYLSGSLYIFGPDKNAIFKETFEDLGYPVLN